jgi:hypothetical protein
MAQAEPKLMRVKALKMFQGPVEGVQRMLHPSDVTEVDRFTGYMLIAAGKAEQTEEKPRWNKDYITPKKAPASDPFGAILKAIESLTAMMGTVSAQKGR